MIKQDNQFVVRVFEVLSQNPTASEIDFLIEAHTRIGYLAAIAQGQADQAEDQRKYEEATKYREVKDENPKWTQAQVEAAVMVACYDFRKGENKAAEEAKKLANLLDSVREGINGIKYLGRNGGGDVRIGP